MPIITNKKALTYLTTSCLTYLLINTPNSIDKHVMAIYPTTEPNKTEKGLPVLDAIPIPTSCVLSASSARNIIQKVVKNILKSIDHSKIYKKPNIFGL